jgi:hypothetical protein
MTPLPCPLATPAAQPPSIYRPSERDEKLAGVCDYYDRIIFVTSDTHCSMLPRARFETIN